MKNFKIAIDALMLIFIILSFISAIIDLYFHLAVGIIFVVLFAIHIWLNRKWVIGITKNFKKVKSKVKIQYLINIILTLLWIAVTISGIVIMAVDSNGTRSNLVHLHGVISIVGCIFAVLHIFQHRNRIVALLKRKKKANTIRTNKEV